MTRVERQCAYCGESTFNQKYCSIKCVGFGNRKPIVDTKRTKKYKPHARIEKLTDDQIAQVIKAQEDKCAVCGKMPKRWVRDHCHKSGKLRGMTCWSCNTAMGALGDDSESLMKAVEYLRSFENTHVRVA